MGSMSKNVDNSRIFAINTSSVTSFVEIHFVQTNEPVKLLIDTGANVSLIKIGALKKNTPCFKDFPIYLKGIDNIQKDNLNTTIAYTCIDFELNGSKYETMFHVIPNDFPIEFEGILGNDILKNFNAFIDFEKDILHFIDNGKLKI